VIVTVSPNPALDLTWRVDRIEAGTTHRVPSGRARAGGKGLNVARVLHQQEHSVVAVTTVGGATGTEFTSELVESALAHVLVPVAASTRRSIALYDTSNDETSIFNEFGDASSDAEWHSLLTAISEALATASCVVGSGSLPQSSSAAAAGFDPNTFYPHIVELAVARGIPSIIDTSGTALIAAASAGATVLKPNREELVSATGIDDPILAARSLLQRGASLVLVSLGSAGMVALSSSDPHGYLSARLPGALAGNATGAGDAAVAAIAACFAEHASGTSVQSVGTRDESLKIAKAQGATVTTPAGDTIGVEAILRRATAWSAAAVLMPLAGEISPEHAGLGTQLIIEHHGYDHVPSQTLRPTEIRS